jgi:hypothetical protein
MLTAVLFLAWAHQPVLSPAHRCQSQTHLDVVWMSSHESASPDYATRPSRFEEPSAFVLLSPCRCRFILETTRIQRLLSL